VVLGSCQRAVAVIVSNDFPKRSHLVRSVLWSVASEAPHGVSFHPHFPSVPFGDAISGVSFQWQPQQLTISLNG